ncbi:MAG TPA: tetratricopeptide repeat protein [Thermoanaerobaculia bacterium]|nr:tetratricopeptide repeat protein [Thermoanaerobaculia bacterium]
MVTTNLKIDELRARLKSDPRSRLFYPLAEELRKSGQFDEAEQVLSHGLQSHASYLSAWMSMGRVRRELRKLGDAVEAFKTALGIDPSNVVAARQLAECYLEQGEKIEAIKKFKLVHALLPSDDEIAEQIEVLDRELNPGNYAEVASAATADGAEPARSGDTIAAEAPSISSVAGAVVDHARDFASVAASLVKSAVSTVSDMAEAADGKDKPAELDDLASPLQFEDIPEKTEPDVTAAAAVRELPSEQATEKATPSFEVPGWVDELAPAPALAPNQDHSITETETMAELYASQGHSAAAADIYRRILERDPGNSGVRGRLEELTVSPKNVVPRNDGKIETLQNWSRKMAKN